MEVLFINNKEVACGVHQYGQRLFHVLAKTKDIKYIYVEVSSYGEYTYYLNHNNKISAVIYNYHGATMPWLNINNIQRKTKNIGIPHESDGSFFDIICNIDPDQEEDKKSFSIPRPIYENIDYFLDKPCSLEREQFITEYINDDIPIFGSFGFGFEFKGFHKIVRLINEKYDKAIIKFVIPHARYDPNLQTTAIMRNLCFKENIKKDIVLMISHEFFTVEELLKFLKSNTMNIFLYDKLDGRGISSVIDLALSVKTPLAISDSYMFRNIYSDLISVYKTSISDILEHSISYCSKFLSLYSHENMINKFKEILTFACDKRQKRGIFYNSKESLCSIWESGKMCYDALKKSTSFILDYTEDTKMYPGYDFAIFNQHFTVNNWMTQQDIINFGNPTFCVVTEIGLSDNPIEFSPSYFDHYIVLDSTIKETKIVHAFGRPLEDYMVKNIYSLQSVNIPTTSTCQNISCKSEPNNIVKIGSFGFATEGKDWHLIVDAVQKDYDNAIINFNIPKASHVSSEMHNNLIAELNQKCKQILNKPGIILTVTHDHLSKHQLIDFCAQHDLNCFFYNRQHLFKAGLAAVTDQAISSGRPLLITNDNTFRHIHQYLLCYPNIGIKEAIERNREGVIKMKHDWSQENFLIKFENLLSLATLS
jgi:hypothetical protein